MGLLSTRIREADIRTLAGLVIPKAGSWTNWIVQGLPGCGVEEVFAALVQQLRMEASQRDNVHLIEIDLSWF